MSTKVRLLSYFNTIFFKHSFRQVAFFLRGLGGILCLSFLKLMLGVIIPTLCLVLFGLAAYRVYKSMYRTEGRGDTDEDESFFPENDNGNGKSEDVIDVRFYR